MFIRTLLKHAAFFTLIAGTVLMPSERDVHAGNHFEMGGGAEFIEGAGPLILIQLRSGVSAAAPAAGLSFILAQLSAEAAVDTNGKGSDSLNRLNLRFDSVKAGNDLDELTQEFNGDMTFLTAAFSRDLSLGVAGNATISLLGAHFSLPSQHETGASVIAQVAIDALALQLIEYAGTHEVLGGFRPISASIELGVQVAEKNKANGRIVVGGRAEGTVLAGQQRGGFEIYSRIQSEMYSLLNSHSGAVWQLGIFGQVTEAVEASNKRGVEESFRVSFGVYGGF